MEKNVIARPTERVSGLLVTTSYHPTDKEMEQARRFAAMLNGRLTERRNMSLAKLRRLFGEQEVLVATTQGLKFFPAESDEPFFFHPSTGLLRVKRLLKGEPDALIEAAGASAGDSVLDCTAGFAADAIVFAHAVGAGGSVTALESETIVHLLVENGLRTYESGVPEVDAAMRRIRLYRADHTRYLREQPDKSVDIVYFDPMFREPIREAANISPLREIANASALSPQAVAEACRVARKRVVLKEHRDGAEFERLGFVRRDRPHTKIAYGVIDL